MAVIQMPELPNDLASILERQTGLLSAPELARSLGYGRTTIYEWIAAGRIPYIRIGSSIRFDPIVIAQWLRNHTVKVAA